MRLSPGLTTAVFFAAFPSLAFPQQLSPMPPIEKPAAALTWDDCVALAAQHNPALVAADYAKMASRASYLGSYNGIMPSVSLTNSYSASRGTNIFNPTAGKPFYTAAATANWNIFSMNQIANIRSAKASYSQAQANQRQASASLRFNLMSAFSNVYFTQQSVDMTRRIIDIQQKNAEEVTLRYESGNEYKGNMMNAKAQFLLAQVNLEQAIRSLRSAVKQLDQQVGLDDFVNVTATGVFAAAMPPDFPSRMEDFVSNRPDVAVQEAAVASAEASVASAESTLFPNLSASFSRQRNGLTEFPSTNYSWSAGATLSYPIFGGGPTSTYYNVKSAKNSLLNQQEALRAAREAAFQNLETNWANYANAVDQAIAEQAVLESYRQRNAEGQVRYAAGLLTFDNWQIIVTQWVGAEQAAINDWQQAVVAQAAWEQALGKALGE